jgi:hypothetical protein
MIRRASALLPRPARLANAHNSSNCGSLNRNVTTFLDLGSRRPSSSGVGIRR